MNAHDKSLLRRDVEIAKLEAIIKGLKEALGAIRFTAKVDTNAWLLANEALEKFK